MRFREAYALVTSGIIAYGTIGCSTLTVDVLNKPTLCLQSEKKVEYPPVVSSRAMYALAITNKVSYWKAVPKKEQEEYLKRLEERQSLPPTPEERMQLPLRRDFPTEPQVVPLFRLGW